MSRTFKTDYQALNTFEDETNDDELDVPPSHNVVQIRPDHSRARQWNHIEDLDDFFTRVYHYHQRSGFVCMVLQDVLQLMQFTFVVVFSTFLLTCVNYDVLFKEGKYNASRKVTLADTIYPVDTWTARLTGGIIWCLVVSSCVWLFRFCKILYNMFKYWEIRTFFLYALKISQADLINMTWHEVQRKLLEAQKELQMCIHKAELTELDIYHRILRFKNYSLAMMNKSLLPVKFQVPFLGEYVFLTTGYKYNLEMIFFWGPFSPFENSWHLKPEYRNSQKKQELADQLSRHILWIGIANFILCPLIFLWQILYSFFRYAEMVKREPGTLGSRRWSLYARLYLRHFNELDHEFNARLNRAYSLADKYVNIFMTPILTVLAKHMAFFAGSILAVLIILTVVDEDVLSVEHVLALMTILGLVTTICRVLIPNEHLVSCPELLMRAILAQIHYIPDSWKGNAHTYKVRDEFIQLYQYKVTFLMEELLSPLVTPFILCFRLRHKAADIIDFYHKFTVDVTGVGDVCSFAQMDVQKHGNPQWAPTMECADQLYTDASASQTQPAEFGKTELSLMHFTVTNPEWQPRQNESAFISVLKTQAQRDMANISLLPADNPLLTSSHSLSLMGPGYNSYMVSTIQQSMQNPSEYMSQRTGSGDDSSSSPNRLVGGVRSVECPQPVFTSMRPSSLLCSGRPAPSLDLRHGGGTYDEGTLEFLSAEMNFSALYMHDIHNWRLTHATQTDDDEQARQLWQTESPTTLDIVSITHHMPNIQEGSEEEESSAAAGRETEYLLSASSSQTPQV